MLFALLILVTSDPKRKESNMVKKSEGSLFLPGKNDKDESPAVVVPPVVGIRPAGSAILVELLNPNAVLGTKLILKEDAKVDSEQAYIVAFGPCVKTDEVKLNVGDRVLLGVRPKALHEAKQFTEKKLALIEIHNVKAILEEAK
jgi:co-chaperonin GroES (HSP10)